MKAFKQEAEVIWLGSLFQRVIALLKKNFAYIEKGLDFLYNFKLLPLVLLAVFRVILNNIDHL